MKLKLGDRIEVTSYGRAVRGTVTMIGHYTGKVTQMRRDDTGQLRAILPQTPIRLVHGSEEHR